MSFAEILIVVVSIIAIIVCLLEVIGLDDKRKNTEEAMEEARKAYFSKIGDIDYYTLEDLSSLSPIGNEETYIIKEDGQFFVKLLGRCAVYDPTIHTIVKQVKVEIIPTCYLFKFRKKGEELWRRVYIIVVSPRNIDYRLKTK